MWKYTCLSHCLAVVFSAYLHLTCVQVYIYCTIYLHVHYVVPAGSLITRSPDLNPLHHFLWGYLKSLGFETPVETDMELVARIVAACDIQNTPGIFVRARQNLVRRCHVCIEVGGRQFEQLL